MKPPKEKKMQKWEYNLLVQSPNTECARCEEALNGLGRDGWELEKKLGPEYLTLFDALNNADQNSKDFQDILSMFDTLDQSCPH